MLRLHPLLSVLPVRFFRSPRPALGMPGASAIACRLEATSSSTSPSRTGQVVLGRVVPAMAWVEAGIDLSLAKNCCSLASGGVQVILDVALATQGSCG